MADVIAVILLLAIVGGASLYIYKAKKKGVRCIGCPDGGSCSGSCASCSGCHGDCARK